MMKTFLMGLLVAYVAAVDLPPNFPICKRQDPKLGECVRAATVEVALMFLKGIPELKLGKALPLKIERMSVEEGYGIVQVVQHYRNVEINGIDLLTVQRADVTATDDSLNLTLTCYGSELRLEADYDVDGHVLILPVVGNGRCTITLINATVTLEMYGVVEGGYLQIRALKITLQPKLVKLRYDNLFGGDPRMGEEINHILNENWSDLFHDVKHGYEEAIAQAIGQVVQALFKQVPYDKLLPL
ncbi:hypothetical protein PPYR_14548 [Photinus pyralis]|uniref:Uncharacterized protein n=1 Tax=Photinus pyralis TaxID=7054 RepID=A0A5N4A5P8_PHOPY|nr:protein takeout-like [Photinus pyralis]KAB0792589.1 hypothetical protein PPYR_14548 [Photinus pyralis]